MSRKKPPEAHANHERWLVSFADFMTLMFAFFVVMFAASQADKGRAKQVSASVKKALEEGRVTAAVTRALGGRTSAPGAGDGPDKQTSRKSADPGALEDLQASLEYLTTELQPEIAAGKLHLQLDARGLVVSLTEAAFFPSGEDTIALGGYSSIDKIAVVIKKLPNPVRLEGHTDSIPIHNSRFRSNWELSAARGIAMLELLRGRCGVPLERLAVAGYAETCPIDSNSTAEGRARNRRVDVVILNREGSASEPKQGAAPAATAKTASSAAPPGAKGAPGKAAPAQAAPAAERAPAKPAPGHVPAAATKTAAAQPASKSPAPVRTVAAQPQAAGGAHVAAALQGVVTVPGHRPSPAPTVAR
jgi:chemotaxis protein MotB